MMATAQQKKLAMSFLRRGYSAREVGRRIGLSYQWVADYAKSQGIILMSKHNPMSTQRRQRLINSLQAGESVRTAARKANCSRSTASRYRRKIDSEMGGISFARTRSVKICPVHGPVNVWPCVACAALGRR